MVGLVTAQLTDAGRCGDALFEPARDFDLNECERVVYVLTLGTVAKYRRRGVSDGDAEEVPRARGSGAALRLRLPPRHRVAAAAIAFCGRGFGRREI